jgi:hypothetical protein
LSSSDKRTAGALAADLATLESGFAVTLETAFAGAVLPVVLVFDTFATLVDILDIFARWLILSRRRILRCAEFLKKTSANSSQNNGENIIHIK